MNASFPIPSDKSIAGISKDQTEAATITPAANPSIVLRTVAFISPYRRNTHAAPNAVPKNGIPKPTATFILIS